MPKAYWLSLRNQVNDHEQLRIYGELAKPAIQDGAGKFLTLNGGQVRSFEGFEQTRVVIIEFPSFDAALDTYYSAAYQRALAPVKSGALTRDLFAVEGVEDLLPRGNTEGPVAYWVGAHMRVLDVDKTAAYAVLAGAAMDGVCGRFLARAGRTKTFEGFPQTRVALAEHSSWEVALEFYGSPQYTEALTALDGGVTRDICIVEGLEG